MFFSPVQLAQGMETACGPRGEKKAEREETGGRQQRWDLSHILIAFPPHNIFCWRVCVDRVTVSLCPDSDWDCGEDDSQDGEDMLCNTMLITGPTGIGKTAAVYACAQELGFKVPKPQGPLMSHPCRKQRLNVFGSLWSLKVFEVNASSQRSGRLILSQLKEATQSHQVDSQGVNAHKPTYFNSYGTSSSAGTLRPGASPSMYRADVR